MAEARKASVEAFSGMSLLVQPRRQQGRHGDDSLRRAPRASA